jgi:hypothetical protein
MNASQEQARDTDPGTARAGQPTAENESIDVNRISPAYCRFGDDQTDAPPLRMLQSPSGIPFAHRP